MEMAHRWLQADKTPRVNTSWTVCNSYTQWQRKAFKTSNCL